MKHPLDSSDEANLILADYLEEYDDINLANEVRDLVLEPNINIWHWEYFSFGDDGGYVGVFGGVVGVDCDVGDVGDVGFDVGIGAWGIGSVVGHQ